MPSTEQCSQLTEHVGFRVPAREKRLVEALAETKGETLGEEVTLSDLLRRKWQELVSEAVRVRERFEGDE